MHYTLGKKKFLWGLVLTKTSCNNIIKKKQLFGIRTKLSCYKIFTENLLVIEMKKIKILITKSEYLGISILERSKTVM